MKTKSEALAKQFAAKAHDAMLTLQQLSDADWKKVTDAEKWSAGVTAHHFAGALEPISSMIKAIVAGRSPSFPIDRIDELNAQHAKDFANCTRAETVELLTKGAATAVAAIRELSDDDLAKSGTLAPGMPPMTAEQLITRGLLNHLDEHFGSIRKTVGR